MARFARWALVWLAVGAAVPAHAALRVGAAKVDQTGPMGPSQKGIYAHEHIYIRAIVIDNDTARAALISVDTTAPAFDMRATREAIAKEIGAPVQNVLVSQTHIHSASSAPPGRPGMRRSVGTISPTLLAAVRQAKAVLQPAKVGYRTGRAYLNVNRDAIDPATAKWYQGANLDAPVDRTVSVLSFETPAGKPIAAYVNYAMHPINAYVAGVVSGDFAGAMSAHVEQAFGSGMVVAFTQGTSGDVNPLYLRPSTNVMANRDGVAITGFPLAREPVEAPLRTGGMTGQLKPAADPKVVDDLFRFIQSEGEVLGEEVIRVMGLTRDWSDNPRIAGAEQAVMCPGRKRLNADPSDPSVREGVVGVYEDAPPVPLKVGVIGIGPVALASVNAEIYTLIGARIREKAPMANTMTVTLSNEKVDGYIPDDASYGHQTFQVLGSPVKPGCAEAGISNAVAALERSYLSGRQ